MQFYYYYGVYLSFSTPALLFAKQSCDYEYFCDVGRMHIYSCLAHWFYRYYCGGKVTLFHAIRSLHMSLKHCCSCYLLRYLFYFWYVILVSPLIKAHCDQSQQSPFMTTKVIAVGGAYSIACFLKRAIPLHRIDSGFWGRLSYL